MPSSVTLTLRKSENSLSTSGNVRLGHAPGEDADIGARDPVGPQNHVAPVGGEFDRVREQVVDDLLDLARVGVHEAETVRALHVQSNVPLRRLSLDDRQAVPQQRRDIHRIEVEQHLPRFHLREVEEYR